MVLKTGIPQTLQSEQEKTRNKTVNTQKGHSFIQFGKKNNYILKFGAYSCLKRSGHGLKGGRSMGMLLLTAKSSLPYSQKYGR